MGHLTEAQYKIIADRMIEEHRKYGDRLRPGHWADVAARKVASHMADFREGERVFTESEVRAMLAVIDVGLQNALHNFDCDLTPLQQSGEEYVEAASAEDAKCTCGLDQAEAVIESLRNTPLLTNGA